MGIYLLLDENNDHFRKSMFALQSKLRAKCDTKLYILHSVQHDFERLLSFFVHKDKRKNLPLKITSVVEFGEIYKRTKIFCLNK